MSPISVRPIGIIALICALIFTPALAQSPNATLALASSGPLRRIAVIVGANKGALGRPALHYSYRDAQSMADTLVQVGRFAPGDVHLLLDPEPQALLASLDKELSALSSAPGESLLFFYYSGHADGSALYPAGQPLSFKALHVRLDNPAATVRVGVIDTCSGGGFTGAKGLQPAAPFPVEVPLNLAGEGSVLIASSSGIESAHESEQLLGSFFTHHFVAGLRGAAAPRGDGVVTLNEAFAYARERTVRDSAAVAAEPQHPSFSMNLHGRADLALARADGSPTALEVEQTEGPLQLIDLASGVVILEALPGKRTLKLAIPAGRYLARRQGEHGNFTREVTIEPGGTVQLREDELTLTMFNPGAGKGGAPLAAERDPFLPREERNLTAAGGPVFGFLLGHNTTRTRYGGYGAPTSGEQDASTWEAVARLGWTFPALDFGEWLQPKLSLFAEGRLGIADWSCCSGSSFERALMVRGQVNLLRTRYVDLYANVGFGRRLDDASVSGAFSSTWAPCSGNFYPGNANSNAPGGYQPAHACGINEWRLGAGVEAHLSDSVNLIFEPDFSLSGFGATALRVGLLFR